MFLCARKIPLRPLSKNLHLRLRLFERDTRRESRKQIEEAILPRIRSAVHRGQRQRYPELRRKSKETKIRGHDADHDVVLAVQPHCASHDGGIGVVPPRPERVAENHDMVMSLQVLACYKRPAQFRRRAEHGEVVGRYGRIAHCFRLFSSLRHAAGAILIRSAHLREQALVRAPGKVVRRRNRFRIGLKGLIRIER